VVATRAPGQFYLCAIHVSSPSRYTGEAERSLRQFFDLGRATAPSILFLDEIDALVGKRDTGGGGGDGVQLRVLSTMLNEMDGVEPLNQVQKETEKKTRRTKCDNKIVIQRGGGGLGVIASAERRGGVQRSRARNPAARA
jgi:SpoVK/Ycf46/Vps4 family AAA+-type ATPase